MNINNENLVSLIKNFDEQELQVKQNNVQEKRIEHEQNIIEAYNSIIRLTKAIWSSNDKELIAELRTKLLNIYFRTKEILKTLESTVELPTTLAEEISVEQKPNSESENKTANENQDETLDELLGSKLKYNKETFQALIEEFNEWDRKITRKNASENADIVELRTKNIIDAYNNIVEFSKPIIESGDEKTKNYIKGKLETLRDDIIDDLKILKESIEVPRELTKKIKNPYSETNDDNNLKPKKDKKQNTKMENTFAYLSSISKIISNTYKGDPNGLSAFITSIELADSASTADQQGTLVKFIKTKLEGKALEALPHRVSTAKDIIEALQENIKPDDSKVVLGRLLALRAERGSLQKFQKEAEELTDQLRRAFISDGMTHKLAKRMTIDKTVEMCRLSAKTELVKSVLASTQFNEPKEVLAKLITEAGAENKEAQILNFNRTNISHRQNFRGNSRGNFNQRENYNQRNGYYNNQQFNRNGFQNQQFNRNGNFNNFRGRNQQFRGNRRGNSNGNWRQNDNRRRQHNGRVYYAENGDAPPPGAQQRIRLNQVEQDEY